MESSWSTVRATGLAGDEVMEARNDSGVTSPAGPWLVVINALLVL